MKIKDVFEADVIQLSPHRIQKKHTEFIDKLHKVKGDIERHHEWEKIANSELAKFHKWAEDLKHRVKLFGFETLNDAFYFLVVDAQIPTWTPRQPAPMKPGQEASHPAHVGEVKRKQQDIRKWYRKLSDTDKKRFLTIYNNADRIRKVLTTLQTELHKFQDHWREISAREKLAVSLGLFSGTTYLDTEVKNDLQYLKRVEDIGYIIGL